MNKRKNIPKVGVALSGGAALGIAHIGALQSLHDHNIPIHCISGSSAGAIIAACAAFNIPFEKVVEKAKTLRWYKVTKLTFPRRGLVSHNALRNVLAEFFQDKNIEDAAIPLAIVATDIEAAEKVVFTKGSLIDALMASTCVPGFFTPVTVEGKMLVDGGVIENFPLSALDELGAEVKIGVNVNRWLPHKRPSTVFDVISKTLAVMNAHKHPQKDNEIFIEPHLEDFSVSDFKHADALIAQGYRSATLAIPGIRALIASRQKENFWGKISRWLGV